MLNKIVAEYNRFASNKKHRLDSARKALALNLTLGKSLALLCLFKWFVFPWDFPTWSNSTELSGLDSLHDPGCGAHLPCWRSCISIMIITRLRIQERIIVGTCWVWSTLCSKNKTPCRGPRSIWNDPWTGVPHELLQADYFVPGSCSRKEFDRYRGKEIFAEILEVTPEITMMYFDRVIQDTTCSVFAWFSCIWVFLDPQAPTPRELDREYLAQPKLIWVKKLGRPWS